MFEVGPICSPSYSSADAGWRHWAARIPRLRSARLPVVRSGWLRGSGTEERLGGPGHITRGELSEGWLVG